MLKVIKENKKKTIPLIILLLLVFVGIVYIAVSNNDVNKDNNVKVSEKNIKEISKDKKDAKAELEKAKESGNKEEIAKAEKKLESIEKKEAKVVSNGGNGGNTGNAVKPVAKPETKPSAPSTPSTPKPKEKQKVWIVDKPAWTETVTKYRNEQVTKYKYGDEIFDTYEEGYAAYSDPAKFGRGNLGPITVTVQVPYTETINHPEQGHWEYR